MLSINILKKHKDFIIGVAKLGNSPSKGNLTVAEIFEAYKEIDSTTEVLADCATCDNIYRNSFKIILAYCEKENWFETKIKKNEKTNTITPNTNSL